MPLKSSLYAKHSFFIFRNGDKYVNVWPFGLRAVEGIVQRQFAWIDGVNFAWITHFS